MSRNILILNGNPKADSLSRALTERYASAADERHEVHQLNLSEMAFEPNLKQGYDRIQPLEADLEHFQHELRWADHWVTVAPIWWGGVPAQLKGLFDRTLLPGFGFKYNGESLFPERLLKGRSARLLLTMDTPPWYDRWVLREPGVRQLRTATLRFCGLKPVRVSRFGPVIKSTDRQRQAWLDKATRLGAAGR